MKKELIILLAMVLLASCGSRTYDTTVQTWDLWSETMPAPTESGLTGDVIDEGWGVRNVTNPTLTIFPAAHPSGKAVLMCPGGGYYVVCYRHEGEDWAETFNKNGITLAVLRYRLPNGHHQVPLEDGLRAMELLREHADELGIREIGVMGFSAGGHLASTIATHYTNAVNRPDFQILVYPVISMDTTITHMGSREGLLGYQPTDSMVTAYSNELQVTAQSPRAFVTLSGDDGLVPIANSLRYYQALQQAGVPAQLHMYPTEGHGWGYNPTPFHDVLLQHMVEWINED